MTRLAGVGSLLFRPMIAGQFSCTDEKLLKFIRCEARAVLLLSEFLLLGRFKSVQPKS